MRTFARNWPSSGYVGPDVSKGLTNSMSLDMYKIHEGLYGTAGNDWQPGEYGETLKTR